MVINIDDGVDEFEDEPCGHCNGSGEGMYDGSTCSWCKGTGVEPRINDDADDFDYEAYDNE